MNKPRLIDEPELLKEELLHELQHPPHATLATRGQVKARTRRTIDAITNTIDHLKGKLEQEHPSA
jgi:hypothetical protein